MCRKKTFTSSLAALFARSESQAHVWLVGVGLAYVPLAASAPAHALASLVLLTRSIYSPVHDHKTLKEALKDEARRVTA